MGVSQTATRPKRRNETIQRIIREVEKRVAESVAAGNGQNGKKRQGGNSTGRIPLSQKYPCRIGGSLECQPGETRLSISPDSDVFYKIFAVDYKVRAVQNKRSKRWTIFVRN